jgi:hypothetical protein
MSKIIEQIAADMGCAYIYDDWGRINLKADKYGNYKHPVIVETLPTNGQIDTRFAPLVRTSRTCIIAFLKPCALDFEGAEVGSIVDEMLDLAKQFVKRVDASGYYEPIEGLLDYNVVLDFLDANMAGVRVTLTLKELEGECV